LTVETFFISDLHLAPEQPATVDLLLQFLAGRARQARHLYILGDLFDAWIGDDDDTPLNHRVRAALRELTASGTDCALMHGNRDFLLGRAFYRDTGCRRLTDPALIQCDGEPTLLMHGDLLCTDDPAYQTFRRWVRNPLVQRLFLWKSLRSRRAIATEYRHRSGAANAAKAERIMDVNQQTVVEYLQGSGATRLIHGHTHRPAEHLLWVDGKAARRSVLGEWHTDRGEVLIHTAAALSASTRGAWRREPVIPG
jgi:UDP-2,3-diacylglucosamine hydrolase